MFPLTPVLSVVLFWTWMAHARRVPFFFAARDQLVPFHAVCGLPLVQLAVRMHIDAARLAQIRPQGALLMNTTCAPQSKRHKPHPHGRNAAVMVTPKPKLIAAPTTIPGRGGKKTTSGS
jgi:hypothetical protein